MVNAGLVGIVILFTIIGAAFSSYYLTMAPVNGQISSYQSEITSLSDHVSTAILTTTQFVVSTVTANGGISTTVTTFTATSTLTEYPLGTNVSIFLENYHNASLIGYTVESSTLNFSGSIPQYDNSTNIYTYTSPPETPFYSGEVISISAVCVAQCVNATSFSASLYLGGQFEVNATGSAAPPGISISYPL
jgi:hypothetical protein